MANTKSPEILLIGHMTLDEDAYGVHIGGRVLLSLKHINEPPRLAMIS